ncbi:hypothetical protein AAFF_G00315780 [Aldrovandia affinis]|uniref:Uncharacterized protein n=1 Tax=Aldrovandia affinis TaxID=143900 RepID=A0AAD7WQT2_9TELE|nr:hypothetical protein AAFF_G00315780 [Aldrovandia affinis]
MATFLRTEKRLLKQPEWRTAYGEQVHELVKRGAAVRLTPEEIQEWKGPVWYVSHLVAPNPHSVTTPVRAVLLRFQTGEHAALGDITKMYNSVWLKNREIHLHRFLWRDDPEEDIWEYAITRVNIGDRPAGCIA